MYRKHGRVITVFSELLREKQLSVFQGFPGWNSVRSTTGKSVSSVFLVGKTVITVLLL